MNTITLSGFVKNKKDSEKTGASVFNLAVSKGTDRNGESKGYFYMRVKVFNGCNVLDGDRVIVTGKLDSFEYNEKTYYEVLSNPYDVGIIESFNQRQERPLSEKSYSEVAMENPRRNNPYNDGRKGPEAFKDDIPF